MILTFYFVISWLMIGLLIFHRNKCWANKMEVSFLVLFSCIINTQTYLGLFETLKWIKTTINPKEYIAFLLFRSVFSPFFLSYFTLIIFNKSMKKKIGFLLLFITIIIGLDWINVGNELYRFKQWNHFFTAVYYILYLIFTSIAFKWFRGLAGRGVDRR